VGTVAEKDERKKKTKRRKKRNKGDFPISLVF
jgi:hypothetical protein